MRCPNKRSISNHNRAGKYHWSLEARQRRMNEGNGMWKGDSVGHLSIHEWMRSRKPKTVLCEYCQKKPPVDLANISGKYKRDVNDFTWLCRSCHMLSDGRMKNLINQRGADYR